MKKLVLPALVLLLAACATVQDAPPVPEPAPEPVAVPAPPPLPVAAAPEPKTFVTIRGGRHYHMNTQWSEYWAAWRAFLP